MTPELSHEDLSRVGCQHSWQEKQWFALPGCHRIHCTEVLCQCTTPAGKTTLSRTSQTHQNSPGVTVLLSKVTQPCESSAERSAQPSVTRAETHRGLAPDFPLQTLLPWAPPNHLSLQPWSVSLDSNTHFQAHCSEGDPSLVPTGCTRTALRGDVPWD